MFTSYISINLTHITFYSSSFHSWSSTQWETAEFHISGEHFALQWLPLYQCGKSHFISVGFCQKEKKSKTKIILNSQK